jgi:hypothetical protein
MSTKVSYGNQAQSIPGKIVNTYISTCETQINAVDRDAWSDIVAQFDDATIYQTWSYGAIRWGESQLSHVVLKKNGDIVAAAQVRTVKVPVIGRGIAYVPFGPLWKRSGRAPDAGSFRSIVRALHEEYVVKRGFLLRLLPKEWEGEVPGVGSILCESGLERQGSARPYRTFLVDLSLSGAEIRKSLNPKWRGHLNRSGRSGLTIIEGTADSLYETFARIYRDMHSRKMFAEFVDIDQIRAVQRDLPDNLKMTILVAMKDSEPVAALVCSAIGGTAVYFLGSSNDKGRRLAAAYALQWDMIERLQRRGYRWYDLGGTDPESNPGGHSFKAGLSGKAGREVFSVGQYDVCRSIISSLFVRWGDGFRSAMASRRKNSTQPEKKAKS